MLAVGWQESAGNLVKHRRAHVAEHKAARD